MKVHSFSAYETYLKCPKQYLYKYGHPEIDIGFGQGNSVPKSERKPSSEHAAALGTALATAMDYFYNQYWWKNPATARAKFKKVASEQVERELLNPKATILWYPNWTPNSPYKWDLCPPIPEMKRLAEELSDNFFEIIRANSILSEDAKAELDYNWDSGLGFEMRSKPDLTYTHKNGDVMIVDGKTSRDIGKYTNLDQLLWYAFVHWKVHGVIPSKVRFLYFRHPPSTKKRKGLLWTGVDDYDVVEEKLLDFFERVKQFHQDSWIDKKFEAKPSFACNFCPFSHLCEEYKMQSEGEPLNLVKVGKFVTVG